MDLAVLRDDMVDSLQHPSKGCLSSESVSAAMRAVPRHEFVEDDRLAYADRSFEHRGTRVLAPSAAARLLEALDADAGDSVLVVGAGVGYTPAVLAEIVGERNVHAVDITRPVVLAARRNLADAGYEGVFVDCRDGADGLPEYAPFDRILVEAAVAEPPRALVDQLAPDGRLVVPLGPGEQSLTVLRGADAGEPERRPHGTVAFAPLLVEGEQVGAIERNRTRREDRERAERARESRTGWEHDWIDWDG
ncbi:protein-L-isoaspartate O-methyltransferase family protein [Halorussus halobius]|uniref:protein-L-isoaspartate O-methyltransferase family protein n=1 Tax=Halorussus halobius TaxID=1710537 RepID=UPI001B2FE8AF|nr:protein-L-isoaspartate O-methyltransferase [Halorussus halobius]